jgi:hypothetical protein
MQGSAAGTILISWHNDPGDETMPAYFGKRVVVEIPPALEDGDDDQQHNPVLAAPTLEENHPDGLAGHPEIQSLQHWLDLQG